MKYYFASKYNFDNKTIKPRIPHGKYEHEDSETKRICVSQSINGCISAIASRFRVGDTVYVHQCESINVVQPTVRQVADVCFTGEQWILEPVTMRLYIKVMITGWIDATVTNINNTVLGFKLYE